MDQMENTALIVSAFLQKNPAASGDLASLISTVHRALMDAAAPEAEPPPPQEPAVSIRRSITPEALVCLEDGKKFRSLKRHLRTDHGLSAEAYRAKWKLPKDYPMVAPTYSQFRSELAKSVGLGRSRGANAAQPAAKVPEVRPEGSRASAGGARPRGRPRKDAAAR